MAKTIEPKLMKTGEYLKLEEDSVFVIPPYQRAYSWGITHCDKLWNDIIEYVDNQNKDTYFFGTVILSCQDNDEKLLLIDGQQRTTTFLLLLKAFLLHINRAITDIKDSEDSRPLYRKFCERRKSIMSILYRIDTDEVDDEVKETVDKKLFLSSAPLIINESISEDHKGDFTKILQSTSLYEAEDSVDKIPYKQKDNKFSNFFRNFKYFYQKIDELGESRLNDVSKAFIEKCEVIDIKSWNLDQAIVMFNSLNSDGLPLSDSDIIMSKLFGEAEDKTKFNESWREFKSYVRTLEERDSINIDSILMQYMYYLRRKEMSIDVTVPGLRRYFINDNKTALSDPAIFVNDVIKLAKSWNIVIDFSAVQVLSKLNDNARLFLSSFFYRFQEEIPESAITDFTESLLKLFAILEVEDLGYSSSKFKSFLFREEIKIADPEVSISEITEDFRKHISTNWSKDDVMQMIYDYDKSALVFLNEYLLAKERNIPFSLSDKYDIEHIMPSSGKNIRTIRNDAQLDNDEDFRNTVNKLGNKILLESSINRSISNEWFRTKVSTKISDKTGYVDSKYPAAQLLVEKYRYAENVSWTKDDIDEATKNIGLRISNFIFS